MSDFEPINSKKGGKIMDKSKNETAERAYDLGEMMEDLRRSYEAAPCCAGFQFRSKRG